MIVVKIADQDIADKVDTPFIEATFSDLPDVGIIFICTRDGRPEDDWTDEDGLRYIIINLPYETVRQMPDAQQLMLTMAKQRLGLVQ